jgi:predicted short-subunit dehydrogenase-like oxidoreductase (DUF2520 family)
LKIGFIGASKAGSSLGKYLMENNYAIAGFFSRDKQHSDYCASLSKSNSYDSIMSLINDSDIVFISTKDDEIQNIKEYILANRIDLTGKYIGHLSGQKDSSLLYGISENIFSLHPLMTFSKYDVDSSEISKCSFFFEGTGYKFIKDFFSELPNSIIEISQKDKTKYHAAAVFASNFNNALIKVSIDIMSSIGIEEPYNRLKPLIEASYKNILENGIEKSLTGPVKRNDFSTIGEHLKCLENDDEILYRYLTNKLLQLTNSNVRF